MAEIVVFILLQHQKLPSLHKLKCLVCTVILAISDFNWKLCLSNSVMYSTSDSITFLKLLFWMVFWWTVEPWLL